MKIGEKGLKMSSGEIRKFASKEKRDNFERMAQAVKHGFVPDKGMAKARESATKRAKGY